MAKKAQKGKTKRRVRRNIPEGKAFIQSTFNNTIVTITDPSGAVVAWGSSGKAGFKGSRKGTPYAAQMSGQDAARQAQNDGMRRVEVYVKGPGSGREAANRLLVERMPTRGLDGNDHRLVHLVAHHLSLDCLLLDHVAHLIPSSFSFRIVLSLATSLFTFASSR